MAESNTPSNGRSNGRSSTPSSTPGVAVAPASAAHGLGAPTQPELRWRSHVHDLAAIEQELSKIWAAVPLTMTVDGVEERRVAARTSVMNLVVIAATPEAGERCADAIGNLTGRHPSRTLIVLPSDPDGPSWVDAEIQAHCMLPREGLAEACSERIYLKAGGEVGRHLAALCADASRCHGRWPGGGRRARRHHRPRAGESPVGR